jgi:hypothetical protein
LAPLKRIFAIGKQLLSGGITFICKDELNSFACPGIDQKRRSQVTVVLAISLKHKVIIDQTSIII